MDAGETTARQRRVPGPPPRGRGLWRAVVAPLEGFRLAYLPLLSVYLASGALGLIAVADQFWVRKALTLTPAELASLAAWLQLPWVAKMVLSEVVDSYPSSALSGAPTS